jgi:hypothetical protein
MEHMYQGYVVIGKSGLPGAVEFLLELENALTHYRDHYGEAGEIYLAKSHAKAVGDAFEGIPVTYGTGRKDQIYIRGKASVPEQRTASQEGGQETERQGRTRRGRPPGAKPQPLGHA